MFHTFKKLVIGVSATAEISSDKLVKLNSCRAINSVASRVDLIQSFRVCDQLDSHSFEWAL